MQKKYLLFALLTAAALLPSGVASQTIDLGSAASYCLFTKAGAMTDANPSSVITGRLGTYTGAYTGFNPAYEFSVGVAPAQHETDQSKLLQVADDVETALKQIGNTTNSPTVLANALGGQTITPGIYDMPAATSLSGGVTLDGLNQTNPLFIFKIGGAFTTTAPYRVLLINGAKLDNVYWRMGGAVSLVPGTTSVFRGIILVLSAGAINIGNGATLLGKALTQAGAMSLDNNRVSNAELVPTSPMPVELTSFEVERQGAAAQLRWATAMEQNNAYFAVESSTDGKRFAEIGRVTGHGSSSQPRTYEWADARLTQYAAAVVYYRLHQVDADGAATYSPIRMLARPLTEGLRLRAYPNPAQHEFSVQLDVNQAGPATIQLLDAHGHLVLQRALELVPGSTTLTLNEANALRPGLYLVQLQQGTQRQTLRLMRE